MGSNRKRAVSIGGILFAFAVFYQQIWLVLLAGADVFFSFGFGVPIWVYGILSLLFIFATVYYLVFHRRYEKGGKR